MGLWRVTDLKAQNAEQAAKILTLTSERDEAVAAVETNNSDAVKAAERLEADLGAAKASIESLTKELAAANAAVSAHASKIANLEKELSSKGEEVKIQVARQVVTQQAALGQPAAPSIPDSAAGASVDISKLFGLERAIAAEVAEVAAKNAKR